MGNFCYYGNYKQDQEILDELKKLEKRFENWTTAIVAAKIQSINLMYNDDICVKIENNKTVDRSPEEIAKIIKKFEDTDINELKSTLGHLEKGEKRLVSIYQQLVEGLKGLKDSMTSHQKRKDAADYIAYKFIETVKLLSKEYDIPEKKIIEGYYEKVDGKKEFKYGEFFIFYHVLNNIQIEYFLNQKKAEEAYKKKNKEEYRKYRPQELALNRLLYNFYDLLPLVRISLSHSIGLKLSGIQGHKINKTLLEKMEEDLNVTEYELSKDPENRIENGRINLFLTSNGKIRELLSQIPVYKVREDANGSPMTDEFGHVIYESEESDTGRKWVTEKSMFGIDRFHNPTILFSHLLHGLQGARTKDEMMSMLYDMGHTKDKDGNYHEDNPVFVTIYNRLAKPKNDRLDPKEAAIREKLQTAFFITFNKAILYFAKTKKEKGKINSVVLNAHKNTLITWYEEKVKKNDFKFGKDTPFDTVLFDEEGNIRDEQVIYLFELLTSLKWFPKGKKFTIEALKQKLVKEGGWDIVEDMKKNAGKLRKTDLPILYAILSLMGLNFKGSTEYLKQILANNKMRAAVNKHLKYIYRYFVMEYFSMLVNTDSKTELDRKYIHWYTGMFNENVENPKNHLARFAYTITNFMVNLDINAKHDFRRRITTKNSKGDVISLYAECNLGYLSQFIKDLESFCIKDDLEGLRKFIDDKFGKNPIFLASHTESDKKDNNKNKNNPPKFNLQWLNDLYNGSLDDAQTFIHNLSLLRFLGSSENHKPFENFSKKEHLEVVFSEYYSGRRLFKDFARYPIFISGDANQYKSITAPIYSTEKLIDYYTNLYFYEKTLKSQISAFKEIGGLNNSLLFREEYCLVPEFNEIFKDNISSKQEDVKTAISNYFNYRTVKDNPNKFQNKEFQAFIDSCIAKGIITTKTDNNGKISYFFSTAFKDVKKDGKANITNSNIIGELFNMWLNSKYATTQQMALMVISPAFFSGIKDLQKRFKGTHSSGIKLDLDVTINDKKLFTSKRQKTIILKEIVLDIEQTNPEFIKAVESAYPGDSNKKLRESIIKKYKETTSTDGQAWRTIESYRAVSAGIDKWSDEQEAFYQDLMKIRNKYITEVDGKQQIDFNNEELTKEVRELALKPEYKNVRFQPFVPITQTLEALSINNTDVAHIPVQLKCSEALLIPELLPEGSKLRDIAEYMTNKGIDVVIMDSAVKVGAWGQVDIKETANKEELNQALSEAIVHEYNYEDYIIQVNVPPHEYLTRLFATQIRKLILGGKYASEVDYFKGKIPTLINKKRISSFTGDYCKQFYNELIIANFLDSLDGYLNKIKDRASISDYLIKEMLMDDRCTLEALFGVVLKEKNGKKDFTTPLCEGTQTHDIVTTLISGFKNMVNKQGILGGSGVQASSFGLKGYDESENLKIITETITDSEGNTFTNPLYAEVEIPLMQTYTDSKGNVHHIKYSDYVEPDGTIKRNSEGKTLIEIDFPGILDFIAYRIPTEREYSMINCKVVRFIPPTTGVTIRVPSECVTIAGFDFDIDKLFFMFKTFKSQNKDQKTNKHVWEEYNFDLPAYQNSKEARDNMLIEFIRQRLMDPLTLKGRVTPGGFSDAIDASLNMMHLIYNTELREKLENDFSIEKIEKIRESDKTDYEPEYNYTEIETLLIINERNQLAAKLIGMMANHSTNHAYCSGLAEFKLNTPIAFGKHVFEGLDNLLQGPEGIDTLYYMAQLLASSVDAVKKPVLGYLNINEYTAPIACLLARIGYDFNDIGLLLNQPIIKYLCEWAKEHNVSLNYALTNCMGSIGNFEIDEDKANYLNEEFLIQNLLNADNFNIDNLAKDEAQKQVLKLFEHLMEVSSELELVVSQTKFTASNALNPSFESFYASEYKVEKLSDFKHLSIKISENDSSLTTLISTKSDLTPLITGNKDKYIGSINSHPMAFEQCAYDCEKMAIEKLLEYFPYGNDMYTQLRKTLYDFSKFNTVSEKILKLAQSELPVYILSNLEGSLLGENKREELDDLGERIKQACKEYFSGVTGKYTSLGDEPIMHVVNVDDTGNISINFSTDLEYKTDKQCIIESWEQMSSFFIKKDPVTGEYDNSGNFKKQAIMLQQDLFRYSFFQAGFDFSPNSINHLMPASLKEKLVVAKTEENGETKKLTYNEFWEKLQNNSYSFSEFNLDYGNIYLSEFFRYFIANHLDDSAYVTKINGALEELLLNYFKPLNHSFKDLGSEIIFDTSIFANKENLLANITKPVRRLNQVVGYIWAPCISFYDTKKYEQVYYMLSQECIENVIKFGYISGEVSYERIYPIGSTNKQVRYGNNLTNTLNLLKNKKNNTLANSKDYKSTCKHNDTVLNEHLKTSNYDKINILNLPNTEYKHICSFDNNINNPLNYQQHDKYTSVEENIIEILEKLISVYINVSKNQSSKIINNSEVSDIAKCKLETYMNLYFTSKDPILIFKSIVNEIYKLGDVCDKHKIEIAQLLQKAIDAKIICYDNNGNLSNIIKEL